MPFRKSPKNTGLVTPTHLPPRRRPHTHARACTHPLDGAAPAVAAPSRGSGRARSWAPRSPPHLRHRPKELRLAHTPWPRAARPRPPASRRTTTASRFTGTGGSPARRRPPAAPAPSARCLRSAARRTRRRRRSGPAAAGGPAGGRYSRSSRRWASSPPSAASSRQASAARWSPRHACSGRSCRLAAPGSRLSGASAPRMRCRTPRCGRGRHRLSLRSPASPLLDTAAAAPAHANTATRQTPTHIDRSRACATSTGCRTRC